MDAWHSLIQDMSFRTSKEAGNHMRQEHFEDLKHIFCKSEGCEYWNRKGRELNSHYVRNHSKEKKYLCDKCDFRAYSRTDIDRHVREVWVV